MIRFGLAPVSAKKCNSFLVSNLGGDESRFTILNAKKVKAIAIFILEDALSVQTDDASIRPLSHLRRFIRLRRIIHLQNPSKLTEKQLDKVRWIVHSKLKPFYIFKLRRINLSDTNYLADNPSLV